MIDYEFMVIIDPTLAEKDRETTFKTIKGLIKEHSGKVEKEDVWGEKKLAYKINRSEVWVYALFDVKLAGEAVKEISKSLNLEKEIWRYMFVRKEA